MKNFYITTTLPYVNADPHIGHAMEFIRADIITRYKKGLGYDVFLNTGTDEHGIKIFKKAEENKKTPQEYVDFYAARFQELLKLLGIYPEFNFIRTTDANHINSAQEFWKLCDKNGFIYKKNYKTKYCIGCELEKTDSELEDGKCPIHKNLEIEIIEEENYFFKYSAFGEKLLDLYKKNPTLVVPDFRFNEIKAFVERGLEDFSISRLKTKMPWGIEVPGDSDHVMYVWFDALVNYISAVGWPSDSTKFDKWINQTGGMVQICGKDNLRQQSSMWQAMLIAAGLPTSKQILINGFLTGDGGVKMSKSLGNVVSPYDVINEYGTEALRYFMASEISPFEDSPFTMDRFKIAYNANLANGIGNLTSRVLKMSSMNGVVLNKSFEDIEAGLKNTNLYAEYTGLMDVYNIQGATKLAFSLVSGADAFIQKTEPFKKIKVNPEEAKKDIEFLLEELVKVAYLLEPVIPNTSAEIRKAIKSGNALATPLFLRKA